MPFLMLCISLMTGIIIGKYTYTMVHEYFWYLGIFISFVCLILFFHIRVVLIIGVGSFFIFCGAARLSIKHDLSHPLHFTHAEIANQKLELIAEIVDLKIKENAYNATVKVRKFNLNNKRQAGNGNIQCYLEGRKSDLEVGDVISIKTVLKPAPLPKNPKSFDYRKYLANKNIFFQAYVNESNWQKLSYRTGFKVRRKAEEIKNFLIGILKDEIKDPKQLALITAITLGDRSQISRETLQSFANTGARHILTVSGMHVGIVLIILMQLTAFAHNRNRILNIVRLFLIILAIWIYSFITGAHPAILRAAFMLSVLLIGLESRRYVNTFNFLFFSAFVILLLDPFQLFQLSFIFSYSALTSILLFYPVIVKKLRPKNRIILKIWQLICVSIAAQIIMLPISIHYFHIAPLFFIISTLIATPLAFLLILLTIAYFPIFFMSPAIAHFVGLMLGYISGLFLKWIEWLDGLSIGTLNQLYLDSWQLALILCGIGFFSIYIYKKRFRMILVSLIVIILLQLYTIRSKHHIYNIPQLTVYSLSQGTLIDVFHKNTCYSFNDGPIDSVQITYAASNHRFSRYISHIDEYTLQDSHGCIEINGKSILYLSEERVLLPGDKNTVDLLIFNSSQIDILEDVLDQIEVRQVILGNDIDYKTKYKIRKRIANIALHDLRKDGAWQIKI